MGNPTAAQEPSMEEILASIRQIISEDGEAPASEGTEEAAAEEAEPAEATGETQADDDPSDVPVTEDNPDDEPEDDLGESGLDVSVDSDEGPDPVLAEIAAGLSEDEPEDDEFVNAELNSSDEADSTDTSSEGDLVETGPYESPFDTFDENASLPDQEPNEIGEQVATLAAEENEDHEGAEDTAASDQAGDDPLSHEDDPVDHGEHVESMTPEPTETQSHENHSEMSESQAMTATAPKPAEFSDDDKLISPESGASVANAFSTLTHTILSQNARTLDDLVSDMLQPMLKEWLDENLPTLVERLVKQEIDRMARGGRV